MQWHCLLCDIDLEMRGNNAGDLHILKGVYCATGEKKRHRFRDRRQLIGTGLGLVFLNTVNRFAFTAYDSSLS